MHLVLHEEVDHGEERDPKSGKRKSRTAVKGGTLAYSEAILILIHMSLTKLQQQLEHTCDDGSSPARVECCPTSKAR